MLLGTYYVIIQVKGFYVKTLGAFVIQEILVSAMLLG